MSASDGPEAGASGDPVTFQPRLAGSDVAQAKAPYNPKVYYLVGFFGGALALVAVAVINLGRVARSDETTRRTWLVIGALVAGTALLLVFSPVDWWEPTRDIRLGLRVVAVLGALGLDRVQRGPALATAARSGEYTSMWRAIVPILVGAAVLAVITVGVALARGVSIG